MLCRVPSHSCGAMGPFAGLQGSQLEGAAGVCAGVCAPPAPPTPSPGFAACTQPWEGMARLGASVPAVPCTQTGLVPLCQHHCQRGDKGLGARESPTAARPVWDCPIPAGQGWVLGAEPSWGGCGALGIPEDEQQLNSSSGTTTAGGTGRGAARKGNFSMGRKGLGPSFGCEGRENKARSH